MMKLIDNVVEKLTTVFCRKRKLQIYEESIELSNIRKELRLIRYYLTQIDESLITLINKENK